MKKLLPWLILLLVTAVVIVIVIKVISPVSEEGANLPDKATDTSTVSKEPVMAADFTVYDIENNAFSLSSMQDKVTVVNFWATWCGYCVTEMPDFESAYKSYGDRVNFMMIDLTSETETPDKASAFIAEKGYTFPVYYDTANDAYAKYELTSIPRTLIISPEGELIREFRGAINKASLYSIIEAALAKAE